MRILAIETSCDETGMAILEAQDKNKEPRFKILSNIVASQVKIHRKYGGVYPTLAKREHQRNLAPILRKSLLEARLLKSKVKSQKSKIQIKNKKLREILKREPGLLKETKEFLLKVKKPNIDAIAVTVGPGLEPCLWMGVNFAKALAFWWDLPIIPVNHIEAHIFANWLKPIEREFKFPAICLVVSGGHTQLVLMKNFGRYKIIGETRDDAAGECFDKTARILGLSYPGGPAIAAEAAKLTNKDSNARPPKIKFWGRAGQDRINLPRPMIHSKNYDFSFSGLKTAVLYDFKKRSLRTRSSAQYRQEMAYQIQQAIVDVLVKKTIKAAKDFKAKSLILGGGVTANEQLREQLRKKVEEEMVNTKYFVPETKFSTDNAAMIARTAFFHLKNKKGWQEIKANANLRI